MNNPPRFTRSDKLFLSAAFAALAALLAYAFAPALWDDLSEDTQTWKSAMPLPYPPELLESEEDTGSLRCRIRGGDWLGVSTELTVELKNESDQPVRLWEEHSRPGRGFIFLVRSRRTNKVTGVYTWWWLAPRVYRPGDTPPVFVLKPGGTYRERVPLDSIREDGKGSGLRGRIRLEAVFAYVDLYGYPEPNQEYFARSNAVDVGW